MTRRLGIVVSHPIQYQVPLYRFLAANTAVKRYVLFLTDHGLRESYDPGFGRSVLYDVPLLGGYDRKSVPNRSPRPSVSTQLGVLNRGLPFVVRQARFGALLIHGWSNLSCWLAFATSRLLGIPYLIRGETQPDARDMPNSRAVVKRSLIGLLVRSAGACLANVSRNRDFYIDYGVGPGRIFAASSSVDTERFERDGQRGRVSRADRLTRLGLDPIGPVVLFAAKPQPWKRPLDAAAAGIETDNTVEFGETAKRRSQEWRIAATATGICRVAG